MRALATAALRLRSSGVRGGIKRWRKRRVDLFLEYCLLNLICVKAAAFG